MRRISPRMREEGSAATNASRSDVSGQPSARACVIRPAQRRHRASACSTPDASWSAAPATGRVLDWKPILHEPETNLAETKTQHSPSPTFLLRDGSKRALHLQGAHLCETCATLRRAVPRPRCVAWSVLRSEPGLRVQASAKAKQHPTGARQMSALLRAEEAATGEGRALNTRIAREQSNHAKARCRIWR